jgi:hypothetical protein
VKNSILNKSKRPVVPTEKTELRTLFSEKNLKLSPFPKGSGVRPQKSIKGTRSLRPLFSSCFKDD